MATTSPRPVAAFDMSIGLDSVGRAEPLGDLHAVHVQDVLAGDRQRRLDGPGAGREHAAQKHGRRMLEESPAPDGVDLFPRRIVVVAFLPAGMLLEFTCAMAKGGQFHDGVAGRRSSTYYRERPRAPGSSTAP